MEANKTTVLAVGAVLGLIAAICWAVIVFPYQDIRIYRYTMLAVASFTTVLSVRTFWAYLDHIDQQKES